MLPSKEDLDLLKIDDFLLLLFDGDNSSSLDGLILKSFKFTIYYIIN